MGLSRDAKAADHGAAPRSGGTLGHSPAMLLRRERKIHGIELRLFIASGLRCFRLEALEAARDAVYRVHEPERGLAVAAGRDIDRHRVDDAAEAALDRRGKLIIGAGGDEELEHLVGDERRHLAELAAPRHLEE